jgi:hypothetical protein
MGILWGIRDRLEDLDFAEDICSMAQRFRDMEEKINKPARRSKESRAKY